MRLRSLLLASLLLSMPSPVLAGAHPRPGAGIPDLIGIVPLPEHAFRHLKNHAPPFGGEHANAGSRIVAAVPEPTTGALVALGLLAIAARKRASV